MATMQNMKKLFTIALLFATSLQAFAESRGVYYHNDAFGSPVAITDQAGNVIARKDYTPYGEASGNDGANHVSFTGHVEDQLTHLTYMQQRMQDPKTARFLSMDDEPVHADDPMTFNRYIYGNDNPYKFVDPDGRANMNPSDPRYGTSGGFGGGGLSAGPGLGARGGTYSKGAVGQNMARDILEANKARGSAGEAATRAKLGDKVAGEQVTFKTSDGTRTRTDFVTTDKGVVETKTGNAQLSLGQAKLKADIEAGNAVTPVGNNAKAAGLESGKPTKMNSCTVDRC